MKKATEANVRQRASHCCEYCGLAEERSRLKFQIEHVIARQHGGTDDENNLALACGFCNSHKGPNLSGIDLKTGQLVRLFIHAWIFGPSILDEKDRL